MGYNTNLHSKKFLKLDHSLKSYKQIKCAISETADLLHAYLHLLRTPVSLVTGT